LLSAARTATLRAAGGLGLRESTMPQRRPFVAGNWKLNGSLAANASLLAGIVAGSPWRDCDVAVCPAYVHIPDAVARLAGTPVGVGAQDVADVPCGAFTGEVSAAMLREVGCGYAIVGHSERRTLYGDTDALVARKVTAAVGAGLVPILCVGETLAEREAGETLAVVGRQLGAVIDGAGLAALSQTVIAYEPVWAIGTGRTATPDQADEVHRAIRALLAQHDATIPGRVRIIYGGSVKAANAAELFARPDIDGGLIGGASLDAGEFLAICAAARRD
jgi:triosephosphate isomerase